MTAVLIILAIAGGLAEACRLVGECIGRGGEPPVYARGMVGEGART
jgi:hypothetical protein